MSGPDCTGEQVPRVAGRSHVWQAAVQALLQQNPCAQKPLEHSSAAPHGCPSPFFPQDPAPVCPHTLGSTHWAFVLHDVKHWSTLQRNGKQEIDRGFTHWPEALHVDSGVATSLAQVAGAHLKPTGYLRQAPAPSHFPSVPHDAGPWSMHSFGARGSDRPFGTGTQRPAEPDKLQLRQVPPQASLQHTPSTQKPDTQSLAALQVWPSGFLPQEWVARSQARSGAQSSFELHRSVHSPFVQRKGWHWSASPGLQLPSPSQTRVLLSVLPEQEAPWQAVPMGYIVHRPKPSQTPVVPQVAGSWRGHFGCVCPAGVGEHVPSIPTRLHTWQGPSQAVLQQKPSTQWPDEHSLSFAHL